MFGLQLYSFSFGCCCCCCSSLACPLSLCQCENENWFCKTRCIRVPNGDGPGVNCPLRFCDRGEDSLELFSKGQRSSIEHGSNESFSRSN
uniref:Putative secreted protein n=1 Tax=Anopheles darlingi TaxID=43151 RepID=A0A2M4D2T3_ANODA